MLLKAQQATQFGTFRVQFVSENPRIWDSQSAIAPTVRPAAIGSARSDWLLADPRRAPNVPEPRRCAWVATSCFGGQGVLGEPCSPWQRGKFMTLVFDWWILWHMFKHSGPTRPESAHEILATAELFIVERQKGQKERGWNRQTRYTACRRPWWGMHAAFCVGVTV